MKDNKGGVYKFDWPFINRSFNEAYLVTMTSTKDEWSIFKFRFRNPETFPNGVLKGIVVLEFPTKEVIIDDVSAKDVYMFEFGLGRFTKNN